MPKKMDAISTPYDDATVPVPGGQGEGAQQIGGTVLDNKAGGAGITGPNEPAWSIPESGGKATGNPLSGLENAPETYDLGEGSPAVDSAMGIPETLDPGRNVGKK